MAGRRRLARSKKAGGGSVEPITPAPAPGPIEKLGVTTYRREVGRDSTTGRFGKYPYKSGGRVPGKKAKPRLDRSARGKRH